MMTRSTIPSTIHRPEASVGWLPRSRTAWAILVLGVAAAAWPTLMTAAYGYFTYPGCFDVCGDPVEAGALYATAAVIGVSPFVAVRIYQSRYPVSGRQRLAAVALFVLVVAALSGVVWAWLN
jgi:hypothetical protein